MSHRTRRTRTPALDSTAASRAASVPASPIAPAPVAPSGAGATIRTVVPIAGMTCRSCEIRIERNVRRIPGVASVSASAPAARVTIVSAAPLRDADVAAAVEAAGYAVGRTPWFERDPEKWVTASAGLIVLGLLAVVAKVTGIADLASGAGDLAQGGFLVALLLGLAAGVSTCIALAGGVVLALSASYQAQRGRSADGDVAGRMRPAVVFVVGRIVGYTAFGAVLGAVGSTLTLPARVTAVLMIVVAIVMTLVGTRLTGLSPRVAAWSPTLPVGLARSLGMTGGGTAGAYSDERAATLGALSFFLPCGFTQAVQVYALSTGSPATAAILLGVFAIGTAPGLLGIAGLPAVVPKAWRPDLLRIVGVVVIGFAVLNASSGLRLAGIALPGIGGPSAAAAAGVPQGEVALTGDYQTLNTVQDLEGYKPQTVTIRAGVPTRWIIESTNAQTCASFLQVPDLGITKILRKGTNEIDLPALPAGTLGYSCSMGMYGGWIQIVDDPGTGTGG